MGESQLQEMEGKISDAEEAAVRGGRAMLAKMESRIRDIEIELGSVQAHTSESLKSYQRTERKNKELQFQIDEDKKNQQRMSELATALQTKIKNYKKQIEDARRSLLSTWPSSGRLSRSWRRARREPCWRRLSSPTLADSSELIEHEEEYFN